MNSFKFFSIYLALFVLSGSVFSAPESLAGHLQLTCRIIINPEGRNLAVYLINKGDKTYKVPTKTSKRHGFVNVRTLSKGHLQVEIVWSYSKLTEGEKVMPILVPDSEIGCLKLAPNSAVSINIGSVKIGKEIKKISVIYSSFVNQDVTKLGIISQKIQWEKKLPERKKGSNE